MDSLKSKHQSMGSQNRPFIRLSHFFNFLRPTYRTQKSIFHGELQRAIDDSRRRFAASDGDVRAFDAQNTLDLLIGKTESSKEDVPDDEIRDELATCTISLIPCDRFSS